MLGTIPAGQSDSGGTCEFHICRLGLWERRPHIPAWWGGGAYLGEIQDNWDTGTEGMNLPAALAEKAKTGVKWVEPDERAVSGSFRRRCRCFSWFSVIRWFDRGRKAATLEEPSGDPPPEIQIKSSVKKDPVGFQAEPDSVQTADPIGPGPRPRFPPCSHTGSWWTSLIIQSMRALSRPPHLHLLHHVPG